MTSLKRRKTSGVVALLALAAILYFRLTPFDFTWAGRVPWERVMLAPLTMRDVPLNVLLFVPLGFGLAGIVRNRRLRRFRRFFLICEICVICGFLFLLCVLCVFA